MNRLLKVIGLAAILCALMAPVAVADEFHSEAPPAVLTGVRLAAPTFGTNVGPVVKCVVAQFVGTVSKSPVVEVELFPTYGNCSFFSTTAAVNTNGCSYVLSGKTVSGFGQVSLKCPAGKMLEVVVALAPTLCTAKFGSQTASNGALYTNSGSGSGRYFNFSMTAVNLTYEATGSNCAMFPTGKDGAFTGSAMVKAYVDNGGMPGELRGIWVE